jgi:hypothetical protein
MAPLGALSQAWVSAEASLPLGWSIIGLWRFGESWIALSEGPDRAYLDASGRYAEPGPAPPQRSTERAERTGHGLMQPGRRTASGLIVAVALTLPACTSEPLGHDGPSPTPEPPAFDVAAVKANFRAECRSPIVVDDAFCEQVKIGQMSAEGDILNVPTRLNAAADERAAAICDQFAVAHFDGEGNDLGYRFIGILDQDGGNAAACSVSD